jgi:hypothetical protein
VLGGTRARRDEGFGREQLFLGLKASLTGRPEVRLDARVKHPGRTHQVRPVCGDCSHATRLGKYNVALLVEHEYEYNFQIHAQRTVPHTVSFHFIHRCTNTYYRTTYWSTYLPASWFDTSVRTSTSLVVRDSFTYPFHSLALSH